MKRSLYILIPALVIVGLAGFWIQSKGRSVVWETVREISPWHSAVADEVPRVKFIDVTQEAGIDFQHEAGAYGDHLYPETIGAGCGFLDFDNDGDQDIFIVNSGHWNHRPTEPGQPLAAHALYRNNGSGFFVDIGREFGLFSYSYGQGVCFGDIDNDGFEDIYVTCAGRNILFRNLGGNGFEDITKQAGVDCPLWSVSAAFLDYDRDGKLDLFVGNYLNWSPAIQKRFTDNMGITKLEYFHPKFFDGLDCHLYRNLGKNRFKEVGHGAGIRKTDWRRQPAAKALGVAVADYNEDGWPDIAVANDELADFLFRNQGDGTFQEVAGPSGVAYNENGIPRGGMGIHWADYRNDGSIALVIGNFTGQKAGLYILQDRKFSLFKDIATEEGLGGPTIKPVNWGLFFFDYDLDGRLDYFVNNGHIQKPPQESIDLSEKTEHAQPAQLFWNRGRRWNGQTFVLVSEANVGPDIVHPRIGRGAAYGDYDGDGDLDILITTNQGNAYLLRNDTQIGHHYLRLRLEGGRSNRSAIGARVRLRAGRTWQRREVTSGSSYASQNELILTFGLAQATRVDEIQIRWPSGAVQSLHNVTADQTLIVREKLEPANLWN